MWTSSVPNIVYIFVFRVDYSYQIFLQWLIIFNIFIIMNLISSSDHDRRRVKSIHRHVSTFRDIDHQMSRFVSSSPYWISINRSTNICTVTNVISVPKSLLVNTDWIIISICIILINPISVPIVKLPSAPIVLWKIINNVFMSFTRKISPTTVISHPLWWSLFPPNNSSWLPQMLVNKNVSH